MAYVKLASMMGEAVTFELDVRSNRVSAVRAVNGWTQAVTFDVVKGDPPASVWTRTLAPGETVAVNVPNNLRFDFDGDLAAWGLHMTPVGS